MGYKNYLIFSFFFLLIKSQEQLKSEWWWFLLKFLEQEQTYLKGAYLSCLQINTISLLIGNSTFNGQHHTFQ